MQGTKSWNLVHAGYFPWAGFFRGLALTQGSLLVSIAAVFLWRRLSGAMPIPLPLPYFFSVGAVLALVLAAIRRAWFAGAVQNRLSSLSDFVFFGSTTFAVWLLIAVLWAPEIDLPGAFALALPPAVIEGLSWAELILHRRRSWARTPLRERAGDTDPVAHAKQSPTDLQAANASFVVLPDEDVLQQLVRRQTPEGEEEIHGWFRARFAAGERSTSIHVAFCPPLSCKPELVLEQVAGPEARLKLARLMTYGARLELKLTTPAATVSDAMFRFIARPKASERAAS